MQGTDTKGDTFSLGYKVADNVAFAASYYTGDKDVTTSQEQYDLLELDVVFSF